MSGSLFFEMLEGKPLLEPDGAELNGFNLTHIAVNARCIACLMFGCSWSGLKENRRRKLPGRPFEKTGEYA